MKHLYLIGYMGCGKSTIGRKLAQRLELGFADTDALIEQREGASVVDIFQLAGESYFRRAERAVLEELIAGERPLIVSTGGGLPMWEDNMARMNATGITCWLDRPAELIARRLSPYGRQRRPRLRGLSDGELVAFMQRDLAERAPFYAQAQWRIDCTSMHDNELIDWIAEHF